MPAPDFTATTVSTLSVRAGLRCSNPDCGILTAGPHTAEDKKLIIGEAAHILGARPSDRRFRSEMTDTERAEITNGIWLCSNCHTTIDKDPQRFPAELLLTWKKIHEKTILEAMGTAGDKTRNQVVNNELERFSHLPLIAQSLIREKSDFWEYMLSSELLEYYTKDPLRRARDLQLGRTVKRMQTREPETLLSWFSAKTRELVLAAQATAGLLEDIQIAWGAPGEPGDADEIDHVCRKWGDLVDFFVQVAEEVKFMAVPDYFEDVSDLLFKGSLHAIRRFPEFPAFIRSVYETKPSSGVHEFSLVIELPDGWEEEMNAALDRLASSMGL